MNVVLIDDEQNALDYLEDLLSEYENIQVVGKYLNPTIGIENILKNDVDLVFLDINMPNVSGMDVAAELKENNPDMFIVFVTAYNEYALNAFEVDAIDYLMKPVLQERLDKTLTKIKRLKGNEPIEAKMKISMLRKLQFILPDSEPVSIQFKMTKVQHLFIYLLHHRTKLVRKEQLIDMLWDDLEEKNAYSQLYNAIYIIRKKLIPYQKFIEIMTFPDSYRLDLKNAITDVDGFESVIPTLPKLTEETYPFHQQVIDIYTENFLLDYDYMWVENERYRLQTLWVNIVIDLLRWYYSTKKYDLAMKLCLKLCAIAPLTEKAYYYLMLINAERGANSSVHYHYSQLRDVLYREIQEEPSRKIADWYEGWKQAQSS